MAVYGNMVDRIDLLEQCLLEYDTFFESIDISSVLNEASGDKAKIVIEKIKEYWKKFVAWFKEKTAKLKNIVVKRAAKIPGLSKINFSRKFETPNVRYKSLMETMNDAIDQIEDFCDWIISSRIDEDNLKEYRSYMYNLKYNRELGMFKYQCTIKQEVKGNYDKLYNEYSKLDSIFETGIKDHNAILAEISKLIPKVEVLINKCNKGMKDNLEKMYDSGSIGNTFSSNAVLITIEFALKDSISVMEELSSISTSIIAAYKQAQIYNGKMIVYRENIKDEEKEENE